MKVTVYLHTILQRHTPDGIIRQLEVSLPAGSDLLDLLRQLQIELDPEQVMLVVNGIMADEPTPLKDGDRVFRFISFNIPNLHYVEDDVRFDQPMPFRFPDAFEIDDDAFVRVDRALAALQALSPAQKREWFGRFITRYRASGEVTSAPRTPSLAAIEKALAEGGLLQRHPFTRTAWARMGKQARLFVSGEAYPMAPASARLLAAYEALDEAALAKLDAPARQVLETLVRQGHYRLQRPAKARP